MNDISLKPPLTRFKSLAARPRRLRLNPHIRAMVRETHLAAGDFIYPLFVTHGESVQNEIRSMPGIYQWSPDLLPGEAESVARLGIPAVLLFGIPAEKDPVGLENFAPDGIVQQAIRRIKEAVPELVVVTDVCLCEYTDHGHCGVLNTGNGLRPNSNLPEGYVLNDETLEVLSKQALCHAEAGADVVAPSDMMDGRARRVAEA
jgi:porphobilinogen synthase